MKVDVSFIECNRLDVTPERGAAGWGTVSRRCSSSFLSPKRVLLVIPA